MNPLGATTKGKGKIGKSKLNQVTTAQSTSIAEAKVAPHKAEKMDARGILSYDSMSKCTDAPQKEVLANSRVSFIDNTAETDDAAENQPGHQQPKRHKNPKVPKAIKDTESDTEEDDDFAFEKAMWAAIAAQGEGWYKKD
jgi:hypothetical protein